MQMQALMNERNLAIQDAQIGRERLGAGNELWGARQATEQDFARRGVDEGANERGIYNSGIRQYDRARTDLGFERQAQDRALQSQQQLEDFYRSELGAHANYDTGYANTLMQAAEAARMDPNSPVGYIPPEVPKSTFLPGPNRRRKNKKKKK